MLYTAGEAAEILGIPVSTVRYYDKEGLIPNLKRSSSGMRLFREEDIERLRLVQCLKKTGLSLKDIKVFMNLPDDGDKTIHTRLAILARQKEVLEEKEKELKEMMAVVDYKLWYYRTSAEAGTTKAAQNPDIIPDNLRPAYECLHFMTSKKKI
ncbi:MerR family transcriptional regulator [uncultured Dialister sp.]|uniref:MerR family transcriptional regulator n=1 Tax=uncultured Dialister sp. TaxID=278064 RepID=UPI0026385A65|nr:MerR family transcriptional regulator [uncultured Dialister sp.]